MKFARFLGTAAALALGTVATHAADLPARTLPSAPPAVSPVFAPTWTGFYIGGNVGGAFMDKSPVDFYSARGERQNVNTVNSDSSSVTFGGGIGYNMQLGSFVGGVEADYNYLRLRNRNSYFEQKDFYDGYVTRTVQGQIRQTVDSFGTFRGRLGYLVTPQFLLFGTGGLAFGDTTIAGSARGDVVFNPTGDTYFTYGPYNVKKSDFTLGYTAGGGVEYALNPNLSVKAEGLYVNLDGLNAVVPTREYGNVRVSTREHEFVVGRVGVNYKW